MAINVTLIPGDGIGPEVTSSAVRCIEATGVRINWEEVNVKGKLSDNLINSIINNKVALKGPITTPVGKGFRSLNVALRKQLGLFANVRPAKSYLGVKSKYTNINLVTIRENLEDLYSGVEYPKGRFPDVPADTAVSLKINSVRNSKNIAEFAFNYATQNKRKKVTVVHKANILKMTDGLFLQVAQGVAKRYPRIRFEDRIVDNMAMQLVLKPELYDVLLCPNLYGDILSDLCAGLIGGLGFAPSANIGKKFAVFEPVHGSAPKYAGKNKVNPSATILSGAMLLKHLGKVKEANRLEAAVAAVVKAGRKVTYDISNKSVGTKEMTDAIISKL